jgi:hypothetical protein
VSRRDRAVIVAHDYDFGACSDLLECFPYNPAVFFHHLMVLASGSRLGAYEIVALIDSGGIGS